MTLPLRAAPLAALIICTICAGLLIDRVYGVPGQMAVTLFVWALLTWL